MKKSTISLILLIFAACLPLRAALVEPVVWESSIIMTSSTDGEIRFKATVKNGWHLYGMNLPTGGPRSTSIAFNEISGAKLVGEPIPDVKPQEGVDEVFNLKLSWWDSDVTLTQKFVLDKDTSSCNFNGDISFQACNSSTCISPTQTPFNLSYGNPLPQEPKIDSTNKALNSVTLMPIESPDSSSTTTWWHPADFSSLGGVEEQNIAESSWWYIFLWGFIGGLIAILTPCVWPMIPMTVSFFLKRGGKKAVKDAILYGFAIVVIYLALGLAITLIFGAGKLNELSTSAIFNLVFFILLIVFAISFFGAFEIRLPSKWSTAVDGKAETTGGIISIFFMAFTLALVSFSCTGPIIGTLLVEAASDGAVIGPTIGMGAFALALAIPFAMFAMFPSWLKSMPKSGGWLNSVKVVLGFLELALSLKFLSVADLAYGWGLLDREVFICLWIVIFAMLGMYLLGKFRFYHDSELSHIGVTRFLLALASWAFVVYLVPGLWGAPLKGVSAFVPPLYTQDFNLYEGGKFHTFHDFDEGMAYAAKENKPVLLDFSGYGCVNCRKMEGAVFDTPEVEALIKSDFVLIELMVDDKHSLPAPESAYENGKKLTLRTYGDKWSYLQRTKFAANVQPYYVVLNNDAQPLTKPYYYDENVAKYVDWLSIGLKRFNNN